MNENKGHGHVFPRPDGMKARCGGPGMCKECAADAALADAARQVDSSAAEAYALRGDLERVTQERDDALASLNETYTDERGVVWTRPTAWAYAKVCGARNARAERAEAEVEWLTTLRAYDAKGFAAFINENGLMDLLEYWRMEYIAKNPEPVDKRLRLVMVQ